MTRRRWIADEVEGDRAALLGAHAAHLARVLRARVGQKFDIAAGQHVRRGTVVSVTDVRVDFKLGDEVAVSSSAYVTLLLSVFKFDRMEWAIEKCTELGAARIIPTIARRTDAHLAKAAEKRVERWMRIAVQASEQSRRVTPPEINVPAKLNAELLASFSGANIVLAESEEQVSLKQALSEYRTQAPDIPVALAIGPEGGWTEDELKLFSRNGWKSTTLGDTILRAETAAIAALAIVMSER